MQNEHPPTHADCKSSKKFIYALVQTVDFKRMLGFIDRKSVEDDFLVSQFRKKKQTLGV